MKKEKYLKIDFLIAVLGAINADWSQKVNLLEIQSTLRCKYFWQEEKEMFLLGVKFLPFLNIKFV